MVDGAADLQALQNHNLLIALRDAARATPPNFPMPPVSFVFAFVLVGCSEPGGRIGGRSFLFYCRNLILLASRSRCMQYWLGLGDYAQRIFVFLHALFSL